MNKNKPRTYTLEFKKESAKLDQASSRRLISASVCCLSISEISLNKFYITDNNV